MIVETVLRDKGSGVVTARPTITVGEACRLLVENRIGAIVVVDGDSASPRIVGIFSERDIVRVLAAHGADANRLSISDYMSSNVVTCRPSDTVESLMAVMTNRRVRHLPVLGDGDALIGIITIGDVVKSRLDEATMVVESLRDYVTAGR